MKASRSFAGRYWARSRLAVKLGVGRIGAASIFARLGSQRDKREALHESPPRTGHEHASLAADARRIMAVWPGGREREQTEWSQICRRLRRAGCVWSRLLIKTTCTLPAQPITALGSLSGGVRSSRAVPAPGTPPQTSTPQNLQPACATRSRPPWHGNLASRKSMVSHKYRIPLYVRLAAMKQEV